MLRDVGCLLEQRQGVGKHAFEVKDVVDDAPLYPTYYHKYFIFNSPLSQSKQRAVQSKQELKGDYKARCTGRLSYRPCSATFQSL